MAHIAYILLAKLNTMHTGVKLAALYHNDSYWHHQSILLLFTQMS